MMDSNYQTSRQQDSRTGMLSRTAGIRESRKFFSLVSRTLLPAEDEQQQDDPLLDLEELLRQTWNIWGVSVLFDFHCDNEVQLKQYAKKLREEVACILSQDDVSYEAKISVLDIQRPKETDHPVVKIEVHARLTGREDKESCVYKGYLLSWRSHTLTDVPTENSSRLPLLLCRGTPKTMRAVHATLTRMFDCMFVGLPANAEDLMWLLPIIISPGGGQDTARDSDEALLEYGVPGLPNSESITIKFHVKNLTTLWKSFLDDKDKIDAEEVEKFHKVLQRQVMEISNVQLGLCMLHRIHLPCLTISGSKMKVMNVEAMDTILTYLNEKALDALHVNTSQLSISK
ncbi:centromere protein L-like [Nasonia vitripennis]|uniref:Centromere protein L n=1 Tax=Nasonia vitripennis TaxID=7425 RepID=A0A7M7G743_NASVI|nr:centromere protein L-like [Nasonia vitripennis]